MAPLSLSSKSLCNDYKLASSPWGLATAYGVGLLTGNIHWEVHLASRNHYCAVQRPRNFSIFGILPATLAPCQYSQMVPEEAPCHPITFGKMPNIFGTLPNVPHLTLIGHNLPHTLVLWPKLAQKRHIFVDNWPWPLTLGHKKLVLHSWDLPWCQIWRP